MERIADYRILENIDETKHSLVYRGQGPQDPETVIIKVLKSENPMPSEIAKLRQEYEIIKSIRVKGVIGVHDILPYDEGCALILEDFNGISLKNLMDRQVFNNGHTKDFLETGVKLAETLGNLHKANIVHKDIKPHNILINQVRQEVKLADFGISSTPSLELDVPEVVSGTLPYMSPEQTGRINRNIDYRTDLYSLGITFYEMLTGRVPFKSDDPMEMEPGDTMLLYTDGITESRSKGAHEDSGTDLFGDDRLTEILHRAGERSGKEIRTEILNSLEGYKCVDDVTVVVLKRLPE